MKKRILISALMVLLINCNSARERFSVQIELLIIKDIPRVQSFSWGKTSDEKWIIVRGRTEGLHKMRPFEAFRPKENNKNIFLIDPVNKRT